MIGVSRPTVNQTITTLRKASIVRAKYGKIDVLNVQKLKQIAADAK